MDKETLSQYGWIVICIIIIALMLGLATPFGKYVGDATLKAMDSFRSKTETTLGIESNSGEVEESTEPEDTYPETTPEALSAMTFVLNSDEKSYSLKSFKQSSNISDVVIPKTYNDLPVTAISDYAFYGYTNLNSIIIPDSVTYIGESAIAFTGIKSISIPNSVKIIKAWAFQWCKQINYINYNGTMSEWNAIQKESGWGLDSTIVEVRCTDGITH